MTGLSARRHNPQLIARRRLSSPPQLTNGVSRVRSKKREARRRQRRGLIETLLSKPLK
jgi:hypothetical protein